MHNEFCYKYIIDKNDYIFSAYNAYFVNNNLTMFYEKGPRIKCLIFFINIIANFYLTLYFVLQ